MGEKSAGVALAHKDRLVEEARQRAADRRRAFVWDPSGRGATPPPRAEPARPLRVLLSDGERTLFNLLDDSRIVVATQTPGAPLQEVPDLVVVTRSDQQEFARSTDGLPAEVWSLGAQGRTRFVLDASGEGMYHSPGATRAMHGFLQARGVRPSMAAWVTQDRGYAADYDAFCDAEGLGADRMRIWIHDLYVQRTFADVRARGEEMFHARLAGYLARPSDRPKRFLSLNRTLRQGKVLFLLKLFQAGLWDCGYISVGRLGPTKGGREKLLKALRSRERFTGFVPEVETFLDWLAAKGPIAFGGRAGVSPMVDAKLYLRAVELKEYGLSWFSVVTDSHISDRLHRITEKPFKPLMNFHPFLLLGSVGGLRLVRAYGFDSYPEAFDESYDATEDALARLQMVFDETQRLCRMSQAELARLDAGVAGTVVFNAWWGLVELPRLLRTHIEAQLIDAMVELCGADPGRAGAQPRSPSVEECP